MRPAEPVGDTHGLRNPAPRDNRRFLAASFVAFSALAIILLARHEIWRDEWQPWLIAKASTSFGDLVHNLRYEGHTLLWPAGLYLLTRIADQPGLMQGLHLVYAMAAAFIFLRFSRLGSLEKLLFVLGYYALYEYCVISRPYAVGILLIFAFCAVFQASRRRKYMTLAVVLFLLSQASVYAVIVAVALGLALVFEIASDPEARRTLAGRRLEAAASAALLAAGVVLAILELKPPPASGFAFGWHFDIDFARAGDTIASIWQAYVPIPRITEHFWNTNALANPTAEVVISLLLVGFFVLVFARRPKILFLYSVGTLGLLAFASTKYLGRVRHHGHLFILLVVCLWLSDQYAERDLGFRFLNRISLFASRYRKAVVVALLCAQVLAAGIAGTIDLIYPFTGAKEAAGFIRANGMDKMLIAGDVDFAAMAVSGYLDREIYYPRGDRFGTFIIYDKRRWNMTPQLLLSRVQDLARQHGQDVLLLLNYQWDEQVYPLEKIKDVERSIVESEAYHLYLLRYSKVAAAE